MPVILPGQTDIYALTDARLSCGRTLETVVSALLGAGVKIIQYREKHMKSGEMLEECRLMRRLTREAGACFIVNDHVDIAVLCEADGVHVGQSDMAAGKVRALIGPDKILGVSAQTVEEALLAEREGADYLGVGAVFPTGTKADANAVSYDTLRDICAAVSIPVIAIGGITKDNVARLSGSGIVGVAVVSAIFAQPDIPTATRELKAAVRTALDL